MSNSTRTTPSGKNISSAIGGDYLSTLPQEFQDSNLAVAAEDFFWFMKDCGDAVETSADQLLQESIADIVEQSQELSFSWIRCYEGADGSRSLHGRELTPEERSQQGQTYWYTHVWEQDRQRLLVQYFGQLTADGLDVAVAFARAVEEAALDADGGSQCNLNVPAAGELVCGPYRAQKRVELTLFACLLMYHSMVLVHCSNNGKEFFIVILSLWNGSKCLLANPDWLWQSGSCINARASIGLHYWIRVDLGFRSNSSFGG